MIAWRQLTNLILMLIQLRMRVVIMQLFYLSSELATRKVLDKEEYVAESDAVAELLTEWGVANQVRNAIGESTARPKMRHSSFPVCLSHWMWRRTCWRLGELFGYLVHCCSGVWIELILKLSQ